MRACMILVVAGAILAGCVGQDIQRKDGTSTARGFSVSNLAKAEADILTEINQREVMRSLRLLAEKLYRRNPLEFRKSGSDSPEQAVNRLFAQIATEPDGLGWEAGFRLAFREDFTGDRVQAYMAALVRMIGAAYEHKQEFYLLDQLHAQKLYNSARNVEVAVWKLANARQADGRLFLLSNSMEAEQQNLSFEREFGKVIALQDALALFIEDRTNRSITRVLQNVASFVFLPV